MKSLGLLFFDSDRGRAHVVSPQTYKGISAGTNRRRSRHIKSQMKFFSKPYSRQTPRII